MDLTKKFSFGINLDDTWRYTEVQEPKSIIFPHLLSLSLKEGVTFEKREEATIAFHHQGIPQNEAERASLALADALKSIGVDFVRCWFPWRFFEPNPIPLESLDGMPDMSYTSWPTDGLVKSLTNQGISLMPVLACGYQRMLPHGLTPDSGREDYIRRATFHARQVVRHYKDTVKTWQIENEPNWWRMHEAGGWRTGAAWLEGGSFTDELLESLNTAVHEEDSGATTMINLEADEERPKIAEYSKYCDVIGLDFYPNYKTSEPVDPSVLRKADEFANEAGKPLMIAETGYPSGPSPLGYTEDKQADYVEGALREAYSLDKVTAIGIWRYLDTSWRSFPPQENHFGLIDEKEGPKAAWYRYGHVLKDLRG
ncbi:MAG: hypothetical protein KGI38_06320 [Thaumarchaeota archaeon]|nr:hypothetical protein [Nitrososphaerota archaeon]